MALINCPKCGKEINYEEFFCPYCNCPIEIDDEVETEEEDNALENEPQKQSGFGITAFVLSVIAFAFLAGRYSISGSYVAEYISSILHMWQNILAVIAFIFGIIGMFSKNRKSGFAVAGNIIAFILFWV